MSTRTSAFRSLSVAILKGFLRDKTSVFFAIIFPLMFLVLFGGLLGNQSQPKVSLIEVGQVRFIQDLPDEAREAFDQTFDVTHADTLDQALAKVRKGDADVAVEQNEGKVEAHFTQTDPTKAAITQGALRAFIDGSNVSVLSAESHRAPPYELVTSQVEDTSLEPIQFFTPGLLGWAVAMSAAFGAAATINGWRTTKLLRRLQLAPVSTATLVGARVTVTVLISLVQMAIFVGLGVGAFGLQLSGAWWAAIPLLVVGTLCFMAIGLLSGAVTRTTEGAVNMANFIVLPMAFLSGSFFPLDGAPGWLQVVSRVLPLRWLNDGMMDVLVRGQSWTAVLIPGAILLAFAAVVTLISAKLFRWEE